MKKTIIEKKNQEREVHTWGAVERSGSRSRSVERWEVDQGWEILCWDADPVEELRLDKANVEEA